MVPVPICASPPVPVTLPAKTAVSARLNATVPSFWTSPTIDPDVPPLPICSVPAAISVPPPYVLVPDALENASVLAAGLPAEVRTAIRTNIRDYVTSVIKVDWPEMAKGGTLEDPVFNTSESILVTLIEFLSHQPTSLDQQPIFSALLNQVLVARNARIARIAASNAGITWAQWIAMVIISTSALTAIAICNTHSLRMQVTATHLYVLVASAAYFVILAHDRPFIGSISIKPLAFQSLIAN